MSGTLQPLWHAFDFDLVFDFDLLTPVRLSHHMRDAISRSSGPMALV